MTLLPRLSASFFRKILALSIGITFLFSLYQYATDDLHLITYTTSDWLINYQGGLVRRGLIGQLIFMVSGNSSNTLWLMFTLQSLVALITLGLILKIFFACAKSILWIIFLLSPGFYISYFLYDTHSALRKENLVFLAMALLVNNLISKQINKTYLLFSATIYGLAVFSHELACFCLPFLLYPIAMRFCHDQSNRDLMRKLAILFSSIALIGLIFALAYSGNDLIVRQICTSLIGRGLDQALCGYSIPFLASHPGEALSYVHRVLSEQPYIPLYLICLALGMLPFALTNWLALTSTRILMMVGMAGLLPLFVTGIDWGRWVHIFLVLTTLCFFWYGTQAPIKLRQIPIWSALIFISIWTLPAIILRPEGILTQKINFLPNLGLIDVVYRKWNQAPKEDPVERVAKALLTPYQKIVFYPLEKNSPIQHQYSLAALTQHKSTNASWLNLVGVSSYFNLLGQEAINKANEIIKNDLIRGNIDPSTLYILPQSSSALADLLPILQQSSDSLFFNDSINFLAPNWQNCKQCSSSNLPQQYALSMLNSVKIGKPISFAFSPVGKNPLLVMGWNHFSEDWGTWSLGKHAQLTLPVPEGSPKNLRLQARAFTLGGSQDQLVRIKVEGQIVKTQVLKQFEDNRIELELSPSMLAEKFITLDFDIPDARSPFSVGVGDDRRSLGIGLQSATFY